jgi:hypothetical protein
MGLVITVNGGERHALHVLADVRLRYWSGAACRWRIQAVTMFNAVNSLIKTFNSVQDRLPDVEAEKLRAELKNLRDVVAPTAEMLTRKEVECRTPTRNPELQVPWEPSSYSRSVLV